MLEGDDTTPAAPPLKGAGQCHTHASRCGKSLPIHLVAGSDPATYKRLLYSAGHPTTGDLREYDSPKIEQ